MIIYPDKEKLLEEFQEKFVVDRWIDEFLKIDEMYKSDKAAIEENLSSTLDKVCKQAIVFQERKLKGDIKYIYFSLLRTSFLENKAEYRIDLYDENWVLDKVECSVNIDLAFIFDSVFKHIEELKEKKKEYAHMKKVRSTTKNFQTITDMDIESIMFKEVDKYHVLAVEFLRGLIEKFIIISSYEEMKKAEDIKILAGEFMGETEIIYP